MSRHCTSVIRHFSIETFHYKFSIRSLPSSPPPEYNAVLITWGSCGNISLKKSCCWSRCLHPPSLEAHSKINECDRACMRNCTLVIQHQLDPFRVTFSSHKPFLTCNFPCNSPRWVSLLQFHRWEGWRSQVTDKPGRSTSLCFSSPVAHPVRDNLLWKWWACIPPATKSIQNRSRKVHEDQR